MNVPAQSSLIRIRALLIGVVVLVAYVYFYQGGGWNQNSRFDLVRAMVELGTLRIDAYHENTGDKAFANGHYYSDKAPGLALLAEPIAEATRPLLRAGEVDPDSARGLVAMSYVVTVFGVALPMAVACAVLFLIALQLGSDTSAAAFGALALGLATPMWAYSTLFWGHSLAGACLVFGFAFALRLCRNQSHTGDVLLGLAVGLTAGWATVTEYPAAPAAAIVAALAVGLVWKDGWPRRWRTSVGIAIGASACIAVLLTYQFLVFGSAFQPSYSYYPAGAFPWMKHGYMGVTYPRIDVALKLLFGCRRGLLFVAPVALAAPFGLRWLRKQPNGCAAAAAAVAAYYFLFNASFVAWAGGRSYGPRYMAAGLPLLCVGLAPAWSKARPFLARWTCGSRSLWWCVCADSSLHHGTASFRVSMSPGPALMAVVLGGQILPESEIDANDFRRTDRACTRRFQPGRTGRPAWLGESDSAVGCVGSRGCSLGLDKSSRAVRAAPNPALGAELSPHKPESIPPKNEVFIDWRVVFRCGSVWSFEAELLGRVCDRPFSLTPIFSVH